MSIAIAKTLIIIVAIELSSAIAWYLHLDSLEIEEGEIDMTIVHSSALKSRKTGRALKGTKRQQVRMSEQQLQQSIVALAELTGWLWFHDYDSTRNPAGFPDLVLVYAGKEGKDTSIPGQVLFLELKSEKGRYRAQQRSWAFALSRVPGVEYYLVRPADIAFIEQRLLHPERHLLYATHKEESVG